MDAVNQWPLRRAAPRTRIAQRTKQFCPALFDEPSQGRVRKSLAQRGGGRQRVNDVSHGAEAHDEQTIESRRAGWEKKESVILAPARIASRTASRASRPLPRTRTNDLGSRVILGITYDDDAPSTSLDLGTLGDALLRVVGALGMKIRTDFANDGAHVRFWKDYDGVNVRQRRQNFRAFFRRHHGPPFALQCVHRRIGIHGNNQFAPEFPRGVQVAYMANMQQIETPVGQGDAIAGATPVRHTPPQFIARNNLLME